MSNQTKGLAALLAAHGRNGDTELMHVTKGEVRGLNAMAKKHFGRELPRNPTTGLREASLFRQWFGNDVGMAADIAVPALAGAALTATGAGAPAGAALLGGAIGAANQGLAKDSTATSAGLGAITGAMGGYGGGGLGEGLASAGSAAPPPVTTPPVEGMGLGQAGGFSTPPANVFSGSGDAFGSFGNANTGTSNLFTSGMQDGAQMFNTGTPAAISTETASATPTVNPLTGNPNPVGTPESLNAYHDVATVNADTGITTLPNGSQVPNAPVTGTPVDIPKYDTKIDYLMSDEASKPLSKVGVSALGTLMIPQGGSDTSGTTDEVDKTLPESEVYYTDTGERRTRIVDRPRFGNVNMARGGDVYGDYEGVDEAPDGGYRPGGGLNYAGGGLAGTGWGEQTQGGFAGLTSSLQPGGAVGDWHGRVYGALGADQVMPGGAGGSLIPGANQYNAKKREEEERKRAEQEAGIAAAAKAKQEADFKQKWADRYSQGMAHGGLSDLGHYSDGGQLLRGAGDGVSDSIPASIEGKRPARLADGEFVVPARAVSELGNGSTEAGSKQLYAMLDRIAKKRKSGKGLAYQANPKKILPA